MAERPAALQPGLLQTVVEVTAERNSALIRPVPVELLRFLGRVTSSEDTPNQGARSPCPIDRSHWRPRRGIGARDPPPRASTAWLPTRRVQLAAPRRSAFQGPATSDAVYN